MTFNPSDHARGARYDFDLATGAGDLTLPVVLLRGARPGKTLVATAGVHGDEYEGVRTLIELTRELDPAAMAGDLLCAPVCNPPEFWEVTRTSPLDGGNLARVFPGRADGSPTEAMAWLIDHALLAHADFYVDLHSAGVRCQMPNLVGYEASNATAAEAARLFGAPVVWAHDVIAPGRTVSSARARGVPSLYAEAFGAGRIDPADLAIYKGGVRNLLHHLGILDGPPAPPRPFRFLWGDGNVDASVTTAKQGFLIPEVAILETVVEGQTLGRLHDLHGRVIEEYRAPSAGVVALIHACPVIRDGDPLFLVTGERPQ